MCDLAGCSNRMKFCADVAGDHQPCFAGSGSKFSGGKCGTQSCKYYEFYNSVSCLFVEGAEFCTKEELYRAIKKEWETTCKA